MRWVLVCVAGAAGCAARYGMNLWAAERPGAATLVVNLVGSFLIGVVVEASRVVPGFSPELRLALTTGFLGGLTTYSAFNQETTDLLFAGAYVRAVTSIIVMLVGCLVAGGFGVFVARRFAG